MTPTQRPIGDSGQCFSGSPTMARFCPTDAFQPSALLRPVGDTSGDYFVLCLPTFSSSSLIPLPPSHSFSVSLSLSVPLAGVSCGTFAPESTQRRRFWFPAEAAEETPHI